MQSAIAHPDIVEQYLLDEIASDNMAGSFTLTLGGLSHSESIDNLSVVFVGAAQRGIKRALGNNHVPLVFHFSITSSHRRGGQIKPTSSHIVGSLNTVADDILRSNLESSPLQVPDIQLQ